MNLLKPAVAPLKASACTYLALGLAAALVGCASALPVAAVGPKVQTVQELMVKLKKGFDEGTLDTPEFYARELGYPLERPETLKVIPPPYTPSREIKFDSGALSGISATVRASLDKDIHKYIVFALSHFPYQPDKPCMNLPQIQAIWGTQIPIETEVLGPHGPLPTSHYKLELSSRTGSRVFVGFVANKGTFCIPGRFGVGQYFE